eukprot:3922809-Prymnesium_polylepis.1
MVGATTRGPHVPAADGGAAVKARRSRPGAPRRAEGRKAGGRTATGPRATGAGLRATREGAVCAACASTGRTLR